MRLQVLSDLHLEFGDYQPPPVAADVVVLAGDIAQGSTGLNWAADHFPDTPIVYVLGNHEFYRHSLPDLTQTLQRRAADTRIQVLENQAFEFGGFVFLGCTLWTDFNLGRDSRTAMLAAEDALNDFALISKRDQRDRFRPADAARLHAASLRWLQTQVSRHDPRKTIVVTHHAPSLRSIAREYVGDPVTAAFASDLDSFIRRSKIRLWVHGHTHHNVDYQIGRTRIYSNQRGYPGNVEAGFEPEAVIEI